MRQPHSDIGNADLVRGPFPGACGLFTVMGAKPDDGRVLGARERLGREADRSRRHPHQEEPGDRGPVHRRHRGPRDQDRP